MTEHDEYLICAHCGQRDRFWRECHGTCSYTEDALTDGHGEIEEYDNAEYDNHDISEYGGYQCRDCGESEAVQEFDNMTSLIEYMEKHTDEEGEWYVNELPKNKRSDKIVMMFVAQEV